MCPLTATAEIYEYSATPRGSANYLTADFRCWIPQTDKPLAGVLVIVPQQDTDGREKAEAVLYQQRCAKWNFALVGCYFTGGESKFYSNPRGGSGLALKAALRSFSDQSGKRELFNANIAVMGLSTGAQFAFGIACTDASNVIAFVSNKGVYFQARPVGATYDVPGLFIIGANDPTKSQENTEKVFKQGRDRGALWALTTAAGQEHEQGGSQTLNLMLNYLDACITARIDPERPSNPLEKLKVWEGTLLNRTNATIAPSDDRKAERNSDLNWFPDLKAAELFINSSTHTPNS
jgi:hypothetical protein